ncbi:unnamed protein product [Arctia plantaginis]|uniref:BOD1/SHG1 domain-containing protein n=1 Tax=Arctia plantaginis TaxID=874455 RepID=A0A8S1BG36_ARCPL|nr:unnamed protein product [Arctia plantaginis]
MAHLQYMPGDPRLVDQLVYELKSKGIFDQFRKECIADVDTRPAYQNLRQRVENSVSSFLSRQCWKPDLNKNQLREKLRKHILDGNYLEQGVERIVDQVVNPKVASVFIPQVEDLVYNYLGISRKKSLTTAETSNGKISTDDLLPTDLEAVSPGSVKSNDDKADAMDEDKADNIKMDVDEDMKAEDKLVDKKEAEPEKVKEELQLPPIIDLVIDSESSEDKPKPLAHEEIKLENIPAPENSPPKFELDKIEQAVTEVPHPDEIPLPNLPKEDKDSYFKTVQLPSDEDSSSGSSLRRNMSPLTPIRDYNIENSCDAQQGFDDDSDSKSNDKKEPSSFRFALDAKSPENSLQGQLEKKDNNEQLNIAYPFNNQVNKNTFNTPLYDDSSNSHNLQIDYESDVNSKTNNMEKAPEQNDNNSEDYKKDKKIDEKKSSSSHKSSYRSRDSHRHSSSKDKRSDSKQSRSRDSSRHDKKSKDDHSKSKSSHKEGDKSRDKGDKKDSRDSSKHRSSSHKSSSHRDATSSKSHRGSSSSQKQTSDKSDKRSSDDKRTSSSHKERSERSSDKSTRDKKDSKSSSHRSDKDKDRKSSSKSKHDDKDKKKDKKDTDDHYSLSGRGNHGRRSTDRDSNDGSSSSKGSQNHSASKATESKKESKGSSSKSDNTSTSGDSVSPCDKEQGMNKANDIKSSQRPIRVENHLEVPIASPPRLPFVPDVTLKKPKFAANLEEAKRMMKMRKFLDEEQKRMNQEAALLLEFQANVRPSLSQVYSSIPGPELEFACINHTNEVNKIEAQGYKTELEETELVPIDSDTVKEKEENQEVTVNKSEIINEVIDPPIENTVIKEEIPSLDRHVTYNENKPFSQLMDEISEISKASEKKKDDVKSDITDTESKNRTEYFEVTIITEELSETDEPVIDEPLKTEHDVMSPEYNEVEPKFEIESVTPNKTKVNNLNMEDDSLRYFSEDEKYEAERKRNQFSDFLKAYSEKISPRKVYLLNCDTYEENIVKEVFLTFGDYEIVNYYKNGHLKLPKTAKNVVKNVNLASEIILPLESNYDSTSPSHNSYHSKSPSPVFSPVKSECSFELSSDYDAKLEEMVNKTSRQQVMEIILGSVIESDNPTIDYCTDSSIESNLILKRKFVEVESTVNNNRQVLTKIRKLSDSDQISSTTEENEEITNNNRVSHPQRSKYLGRARRVGLSRPKKTNLPNSPSSDKSVENYEQNTPVTLQTPNGKMKSAPRNKVQRYDKSDLYKPKLHYLSRRNNIS